MSVVLTNIVYALQYNKQTNMGNVKTNKKKELKSEVITVRVPGSVHKALNDMTIDKINATGKIHKISETVLSVLEAGLSAKSA